MHNKRRRVPERRPRQQSDRLQPCRTPSCTMDDQIVETESCVRCPSHSRDTLCRRTAGREATTSASGVQ
eukprot:5760384-Pleurochrysis_carterae.AAC.1